MCLACDRDALWFMEIETIAVAARAGSRRRKKAMPHPRGSDGLERAGRSRSKISAARRSARDD
jgi:hypothetical protein